ncbi:hypothetical protein CMI37_36305 [Candidatus Pacearchaeota archaeon]|nr:hypothetical protein [Candidatus Pacearchaeota archaeon]
MAKKGTEVAVSSLPNCQIPECERRAFADAAIPRYGGTWGYVCKSHFNHLDCKLGPGRGQKLIITNPPCFGHALLPRRKQ